MRSNHAAVLCFFLLSFLVNAPESISQVCNLSQIPTNLRSGLVAYYPFCGNANDVSGNENNGTVIGASLAPDRFGVSNNAFSFNGNSYLSLSNTFFNGSTSVSQLSYSIWFLATQMPSSGTSFHLSNKEGYWRTTALSLSSDGTISFGGSQPSPQGYWGITSASNIFQINVWNHVVITYASSVLKMYLNGTLIKTVSCPYSVLDFSYLAAGNSTSTNLIGAANPVSPGLTNFMRGRIDDFMIFSRALSECEVQQLYTATSSEIPASGTFSFNPLSDTTRVCGTTATLNAGSGYSTYSWNTGATTQSINPTVSGFYKVTVTSSAGCTASDSTYLNLLNVRITPGDTSVCNSTLTLQATAQDLVDTLCFRPPVKTSGNLISFASTVVRDRYNNVYHSGAYSGNITIGSTALTSIGGRDFFVSKYDNCGNLQWAISGGSTGNEDITGNMAADAAGNLYVVGRYNQTCTIYGTGGTTFVAPYTTTSNANHQDGFLVKLSPTGAVMWGVTIRGGSNDGFERVTVDPSGNPIVTGQFNGCCPGTFASVIYGTTNTFNLSSSGNNYSTAIVVKLNTIGTVLWALRLYSRDGAGGPVKTDAIGNIYAIGSFRTWSSGTSAQVTDGLNANSTLLNPGKGLGYLLKIAPSGALQWGVTYGNVGDGVGSLTNSTGLDFDGNGSVWISGFYSGAAPTFYSVTGANLSGPASTNNRGFVVKYSPSGQALSVGTFQQTPGSNTIFNALACNGNEVKVVGYYAGATLGSNDVLIAGFNSSAVLQSIQTAGGAGDDRAYDICNNNTGYLISGTAATGASIGGTSVAANASFLWNTSPNRVPIFSYLWSTGATTNQITVSPTQTTTYYVTVSDGITSCTDSVRVIVSIGTFNPFSDTTRVCGTSTVLNAGSGYSTYSWSNGSTSQSNTVTTSGAYRVTVSNAAGCTATDSTYLSLVNARIINNDTTICRSTPLTLSIDSLFPGRTACTSAELPANLRNGLVGYWPFCGNANDASGNGNNGVVNGAALTSDRFGIPNSAYSFNGTSNLIRVTRNPNLEPSNELTVACWILPRYGVNQPSEIPSDATQIVRKGQANQGGYHLSWSNLGNNRLESHYYGNWGSVVHGVPNEAYKNNWHLVVMTYSTLTNISRLFIDGILVSSQACANLLLHSDDLFIGAFSGYQYFNGKIDDVAIWDRALSQSEVNQLYNSAPTVTWSTGATTNSITVSPTQTTTYYVTVSDGITSCTDSVRVTVSDIGTFNPLSDTTRVCGTSTVLNAGSGYTTYSWSNGSTSQSNTVTTSGVYRITVSNAAGCTATDSTYLSLVKANILNNDTTICKGSSITLSIDSANTSSGTQSYAATFLNRWTHDFITQVGQTYRLKVTGRWRIGGSPNQYYDAAFYINGQSPLPPFSCSATLTQSAHIWYRNLCGLRPTPDVYNQSNTYYFYFTANDQITKIGFDDTNNYGDNSGSLLYELTQFSTNSVTWSTGATTNQITVSPTQTTTYYATVSDGITTCTDSVRITVATVDTALVVLDPVQVCTNGGQVRMQAGVASGYQWLRNGVAIVGATSRLYTATQTGAYRVALVNTAGCRDTSRTVNISLYPQPVSGFNINPNTQCFAGNQFSFTNTTTLSSGTLSYLWNFGNGITSTQSSPTYSYPATGTYIVKLVATSGTGCKDSTTRTITVNPSPTATFAVNTASQCVTGNQFNFTNNSSVTTGTLTYAWTFGDGNISANANPTHSYINAGTYTVKLVVTSGLGCKDSTTRSVTVFAKPTVDFSVNSLAQCINGNSFVFTNNTTIGSGTVSYVWRFGDGNTATTANATHSYLAAGTYTVKLIAVSNNGCSDSTTRIVTVNPKPTVNFSINTIAQCLATNQFVFTNLSTITTGTLTHAWSFGNGATSVQPSPSYSYIASGSYNVKLVSTSAEGCKDSITRSTTVHPMPTGTLNTPTTNLLCEGGTVTLTASGGTTYQWFINGGAIVGATTASHAATQPGTYTVNVVSANGCIASATGAITLQLVRKPTVNFTFDKFCAGFPTQFTDQSNIANSNVVTYTWNFGQGQGTSSLQNPTHTFPTASTYSVSLIVTPVACPSLAASITKPVAVVAPPANQRYVALNAVENRDLQLEARVFGGATYSWSPSTGLSSSLISNPIFNYTTELDYVITITTGIGCVIKDTQLVRIFKEKEIYVPKGFSPNGDGNNDRIFPRLVGVRSLNYFKVYNRWGQLIFMTTNINEGWDGTHKGVKQPMEGYVWIAEGVDFDNNIIKRTGTFLLLR